jgi:hypothetical protein
MHIILGATDHVGSAVAAPLQYRAQSAAAASYARMTAITLDRAERPERPERGHTTLTEYLNALVRQA